MARSLPVPERAAIVPEGRNEGGPKLVGRILSARPIRERVSGNGDPLCWFRVITDQTRPLGRDLGSSNLDAPGSFEPKPGRGPFEDRHDDLGAVRKHEDDALAGASGEKQHRGPPCRGCRTPWSISWSGQDLKVRD